MSFVLDASSLKTPQQLELAARAKAAALPPAPPPAPNPSPAQNPPGIQTQLSVEPPPMWDTSTIEAERATPVQPVQGSMPGPLSNVSAVKPEPIDASSFDRIMPLPIFDGGKWSDEELRPAAGAGDKTSPVGNGVTPTFSPNPAAAASGPNAAQGLNNLPQNAPNATQVSQKQVPNAPQLPLSSFTYGAEARTDAHGNPVVYNTPKNDAGVQEIAGFTLADNPEQFNIIKNTPLAQRKQVILDLMDKYTAPAANWSQDPGVQGLLRDVVFHRGPGGAQAILGMALGGPTQRVGAVTPQQIQALNQMDPVDAIQAITEARKSYEDQIMGTRKNLSEGLNNRFNQARINFTKLHLNGDQS